jgi:glycosyltransferase involved in cell wall biosynthesis
MTICDFSPLYCDKGGGIRTYHHARIDWFRRQSRHRYVLISPGPRLSTRGLSPSVLHVQVFGVPLSRDPDRYRLLIDYPSVESVVAHVRPDVFEANDPWFSAPCALVLRKRGVVRGLVTSFFHGDPICYMEARMPRLAAWLERALVRVHGGFDAVLVSSESMQRRLSASGLSRVHRVTFGVNPEILTMRRRRFGSRRPARLLYVGRLDDDKDFKLVLQVLPAVLRRGDVRVTVVGTGRYDRDVAAIAHPRLRYLGFVGDRAVMRSIYANHDILLAPGRFETFALSALEGMAAGLLVIGPDEGGTHELLAAASSPLQFRAGDPTMFLDRIQAAIDCGGDLVRERGQRLAATYGTWDDAVLRQVALYESLLEGHAAASIGRSA